MKVIRLHPNEGGAYPAIQEGGFRQVPEGMALWPEVLSSDVFYTHNGFVTLTVSDVDGVPTVTAVEPNAEAWEVWQAEHPPVPDAEPEPAEAEDTAAMLVDHEYRLTLLELGISV